MYLKNEEIMAKKTIGGKIYVTFTIDEAIKIQFNLACVSLGLNMSETVEAMMQNFLDISKESVEKASEQFKDSLDIEVFDETRLKFE